MKGIEPIIAAVLVIMISIVGIVIVLETSQPSVDRMGEIAILNEAKDVMKQIDNAVNSVSQEDEGSTRILDIAVSGGDYLIDAGNEAIVFSMDSRAQIVGIGVSNAEGPFVVKGEKNKVLIELSYPNVDINTEERFGRGYHNLIISNVGYDFAEEKQKINISKTS